MYEFNSRLEDTTKEPVIRNIIRIEPSKHVLEIKVDREAQALTNEWYTVTICLKNTDTSSLKSIALTAQLMATDTESE